MKTMLNKTNSKLIVGSEKLFLSNNLLTSFSKDHDIFQISIDPQRSLEEQSRVIWRDLKNTLDKPYSSIVFMGLGYDCNVRYELYRKRKFVFDGAIFVNPIIDEDISDEELVLEQDKTYSFSTQGIKKTPANLSKVHQCLPRFHGLRSRRLALEIYGCVVYGFYQQDYLSGANTEFIR
jgi:hypothetical protein